MLHELLSHTEVDTPEGANLEEEVNKLQEDMKAAALTLQDSSEHRNCHGGEAIVVFKRSRNAQRVLQWHAEHDHESLHLGCLSKAPLSRPPPPMQLPSDIKGVRGTHIRVCRAPEPGDLIWENQTTSIESRRA